MKAILVQRFELTILEQHPTQLLLSYTDKTSRIVSKPLNIILSQVNTVNNDYRDLLRLIIMRKYLIKSYSGKCHAIGKPVSGQRT